jgi:hypothetical protein
VKLIFTRKSEKGFVFHALGVCELSLQSVARSDEAPAVRGSARHMATLEVAWPLPARYWRAMMTETERVQWITILDAAARRPGDELNEEWEWLMDELGLPCEYYLSVIKAIAEDRWRKAKNPRAYVKTVAKREAKKRDFEEQCNNRERLLNLPASRDGSLLREELSYCQYRYDTSETVQGNDGVWRRGAGGEDNYGHDYDPDDPDEDLNYPDNPRTSMSFRNFLLSKVPADFKRMKEASQEHKDLIDELNAGMDDHHFQANPRAQVDWEVWAGRAGFDEWDFAVFKYKLGGTSRDRALAEQPDDVSRKALQAAWRKFDRTGVERLQAVIQALKCPGNAD